MSSGTTLDQVEHLAAQLSSRERLTLMAHICEDLSAGPSIDHRRHEVSPERAEIETWLAECDELADGIEGDFDATDDIRELRDRRVSGA